jgi:PleD family two-component response regulator
MKRRNSFLEIEHSVWVEAQFVADVPSRQVVLIVEDEALVRMTAVDMIEEAGFAVLESTNADEAILLLEARRDITVVFATNNDFVVIRSAGTNPTPPALNRGRQ